jgi:hypothetical protein
MIALLLSLAVALPQSTDSNAARVYATVLDSFFVGPTTRQLLLRPRTVTGVGHIDDQDYASGIAGLAPLPPGLQADFELHRREQQVVPTIPTRVPTKLYKPTLADALPRNDPDAFWTVFEQKYPGANGILAVSPVGFSTDGRAALVMVDHTCGSLCGATVYYLLERRGVRWIVLRQAEVRVS